MVEPHDYEDAQGRTWRIRLVQVVETDPMFAGAGYTYSVEGPGGSSGTEGGLGFEVSVRFAPIFYDLLTLEQRRGLRGRALGLVEAALDRGQDGPAEIRVSSDGAAKLDGETLEWCLPLRQPA